MQLIYINGSYTTNTASLRRFVGVDLGRKPMPDATTMLKFAVSQCQQAWRGPFAKVGQKLRARGFEVNAGTIVDAAPTPTAKDFTNQSTRHNRVVDEALRAKNRNKSRIHARVEHVLAWSSGYGALARCDTGV